MAVENKDLLNTIRKDASLDYRERVPKVDSGTGSEVWAVLEQSPLLMNEFITTIANRVVKTKFLNKVWENSLKEIKGGSLTYGKGIQQIFSELVERKGFDENYGDTPEQSLIGKTLPKIEQDFIVENFKFKYKVSIGYEELRGAFLNQFGLSNMVTTLFTAQQNKAEQDEYESMKGCLIRKEKDNTSGANFDKGVIQQIVEDSNLKNTAVKILPKNFTSNQLAIQLKTFAKKMKFQTQKYNLSKMTAHSRLEDLVIYTSPEYEATLDVETLAFAFNVDKAKAPTKILTIDEFPQYEIDGHKYEVVAVLADRELVQQHDTVTVLKPFDNGESLYTNYWLHRHGISAICKFAQCFILLVEAEQ